MPHYVVERTFPNDVSIPLTDDLAKSLLDVDDTTGCGVIWLSSYVDSRRARTYCLFEGPDSEAISRAAGSGRLPVERIVEVRVLDPYLYR